MANNKNFIAKNGVSTGDGYAMPDVRPSLLLDFANSKTLDPRITFTRGSTATYWDGKTTAKAEENLQPRSTDFNSTYWLRAQTSLTLNYATAPDGTSTAGRLYEDAVNAAHYIHGNTGSTVTTANGVVYTWSIYAKKGSGTSAPDNVQLCFRGNTHSSAYANFNISTGVVASSFNLDASSITDVGNGWYRLVITATANSSGSGGGGVFVLIDDNASANRLPAYTGDTNADVLLWGPQFEQRSSATAYTPTTSAPIVKYQPVLQTAASGEARFDHDPVTGESKGLLIEEARTNLNSVSETFNTGAYVATNATKYIDRGISPDGTQSAVQVSANYGQTTPQGMVRNITCSANTTYTSSTYVKMAGYRYLTFWIDNGGGIGRHIQIDGTDGSITNTYSNEGSVFDPNSFSQAVEDVGNGWYRISITYKTLTGISTINHRWYSADTSGSANFGSGSLSSAASGENGLLVWGVQMEVGSFPTSYIPTSGSTVTRSRDEAIMTGTNFTDWYNYGEGTLYVEAPVSAASGITTHIIASVNDNTNNNAIQIYSNSQNNITAQIFAFSTGYYSEAVASAYGSGKAAIGYALNNTFFAANGEGDNSGTDTSVQPPSLVDQLRIGQYSNGGLSRNGAISKIAFYPQRLSNATLEAMTEE